MKKVKQEAVQTFVSDSVLSWADSEFVSCSNILYVYILPLDKLGAHWVQHAEDAVKMMCRQISAGPATTCGLVMAPNTGGPDEALSEDVILKAENKIDDLLRADEFNLHVRNLAMQRKMLNQKYL